MGASTDELAEGHARSDRQHAELEQHPSVRQYIWVAAWLGIATGLEVALYYLEVPRTLLIALLLSFALVKFALVVLYFMHLKFDARIFRRLFVTGMILAISVYLVVLTIFGVVVR